MNQRWLPVALRLWFLFMISYGYFVQVINPNIASRLGLVISMVDRHQLQLGPFATPHTDEVTTDEALFNGVYYSDKAPGLSLMAAPFAAAVEAMLPHRPNSQLWFNPSPRPSPGPGAPAPRNSFSIYYVLLGYVATLTAVSAISALALAGIYVWCREQGSSQSAAIAASIALGLCSPFWGWSTVFLGHATSGALLFIGFALLSTTAATRATGLLAGLALGAAFVTEFTAGPAVAIIGIGCCIAAMRGGDRLCSLRRVFLPAAIGLGVALIPLAAYNHYAFGSAFKLGYEGVAQNFPGMQRGFFGLSWPNPTVAFQLLFGASRGLVIFWPAFLLIPISVVLGLRAARFRLLAGVASLVFLSYLAINASYYYWDGGFSTGPRHLIPALPLLAPLLARFWDWHPKWTRPIAGILLSVSLVFALAFVSINMFAPPQTVYPHPLTDLFLPSLLTGDMHRTVLAHFSAVNPYVALVPLFLAWAGIGWSFRGVFRQDAARDVPLLPEGWRAGRR